MWYNLFNSEPEKWSLKSNRKKKSKHTNRKYLKDYSLRPNYPAKVFVASTELLLISRMERIVKVIIDWVSSYLACLILVKFENPEILLSLHHICFSSDRPACKQTAFFQSGG